MAESHSRLPKNIFENHIYYFTKMYSNSNDKKYALKLVLKCRFTTSLLKFKDKDAYFSLKIKRY